MTLVALEWRGHSRAVERPDLVSKALAAFQATLVDRDFWKLPREERLKIYAELDARVDGEPKPLILRVQQIPARWGPLKRAATNVLLALPLVALAWGAGLFVLAACHSIARRTDPYPGNSR